MTPALAKWLDDILNAPSFHRPDVDWETNAILCPRCKLPLRLAYGRASKMWFAHHGMNPWGRCRYAIRGFGFSEDPEDVAAKARQELYLPQAPASPPTSPRPEPPPPGPISSEQFSLF